MRQEDRYSAQFAHQFVNRVLVMDKRAVRIVAIVVLLALVAAVAVELAVALA
jgi:hypothetical protein